MQTALRAVVIVIGGLFLLIGIAGMFTPENFASGLGLSLDNPDGAGSVRAMIGAHYVAMGGVCLFAVIRHQPVLLFPIAAIEVVMVIARGIAAVNGEFSPATLVPTSIEVIAATALTLAAMQSNTAERAPESG